MENQAAEPAVHMHDTQLTNDITRLGYEKLLELEARIKSELEIRKNGEVVEKMQSDIEILVNKAGFTCQYELHNGILGVIIDTTTRVEPAKEIVKATAGELPFENDYRPRPKGRKKREKQRTLYVAFPDRENTIFYDRASIRVFLNTIREFGVKNVAGLNLPRVNSNLVTLNPNPKYIDKYVIVDGYYVYTKINNKNRKLLLENIARQLHINCNIVVRDKPEA